MAAGGSGSEKGFPVETPALVVWRPAFDANRCVIVNLRVPSASHALPTPSHHFPPP